MIIQWFFSWTTGAAVSATDLGVVLYLEPELLSVHLPMDRLKINLRGD